MIFKHSANFWRKFAPLFFEETDSWWCEEGRSCFFPFAQCLSLGGKQFYITTFSFLSFRSRKFHISFSRKQNSRASSTKPRPNFVLIRTKKQQKILKSTAGPPIFIPKSPRSVTRKIAQAEKSWTLKQDRKCFSDIRPRFNIWKTSSAPGS